MEEVRKVLGVCP